MNISDMSLSFNERVIFSLRSLYSKYGYTQYKMSKFEEYDLYARNKEFLISDSVITFTDTNGKLMALKPDVTLSIIKNTKDTQQGVQKVYYNENVYRASKATESFKEIMQVGVECFGKIDSYCICEIVNLAAESLRKISPDCLLDISDISIISEVVKDFCIPESCRKDILRCISQKNTHELAKICGENGVSQERTDILCSLASINGRPDGALEKARELLEKIGMTESLKALESIVAAFADSNIKDMLRIDFSVVDDINYYNGIVFKGFVNGVPGVVLSGGQYDNLMKKMHRKSGAVGFAVYLDMLERMGESNDEYDVDVVIVYDDRSELSGLNKFVKSFTDSGKSVSVQKEAPLNIKYKQLVKYSEGEVVILENNA